MWPSGGATLGYIALTATAMSSNAHVHRLSNNLLRAYHPIRGLCRHMNRNRTGTGTLGAFGCCRKHHSTHVLERHRKHPQMGKPSDVVLQLSAVACPWKQFCFGFGLLSRCRPADSWWSPDPREQVKKKKEIRKQRPDANAASHGPSSSRFARLQKEGR